MRSIAGVVAVLVVASAVECGAVDRYISPSGSNTNTCVQAQDPSTPKATLSSVKSCMAAGDTTYISSGDYTGNFDITGLAGSDASRFRFVGIGATTPRFLGTYTPTVGSTRGSCRVLVTSSTTNGVWIENIKFDASTLGCPNNVELNGNMISNASNVTFKNVEWYYWPANTYINSSTNIVFEGGSTHDAQSDCAVGRRHYGFYIQKNNTNITVQDHEIYNMPGGGVQVYPGPANGITIRRDRIHHNSWCTTTPQGAVTIFRDNSTSGPITNVKIYDNLIYKHADPTGGTGHGVRVGGDITGVEVYNNTIYGNQNNSSSGDPAYGIMTVTATCATGTCSPTGLIAKNNIVIGNEGGQINTATGSGHTVSDNITTGVAADYFVDATNDDYRLKQGTNTARDAGVSVSTRPSPVGTTDVGAYEQGVLSSAVVTSGFIEVTANVMTPALMPSTGITGFTVSCVGCTGTPSVSEATVVSATVIRLTIIGITSNGTCTISLGSSNLKDSGYIGPSSLGYSQYVNSVSGLAVSGTCQNTAGGGTSLPGTPYILYEFDDNLSDSSGNNLHIVTSNGTSFTTGKYHRGLKTDTGEDDYVEIPYFSGVNPSTQSLTIAGGVYIQPADVCALKAVGGTDPGVNQYFHVYYSGCTWKMLIQESTASNTEFSVQSGWNHVCINLNAATDTATMYINRTPGAVSGGSVQTYTSFNFAGNFRIGRFVGSGLATGPNHIYDRWVVYTSVQDCTQIYDNWEPPSGTWTGTLSMVAGRFYMAKTDPAAALIPLAPANNTNITLPPGAAAGVALQTDCTTANCSAIGQKLYYSCAACPSGGTEIPVPDSASTDGVRLWGGSLEPGLLSGAQGANLSGALAHTSGGTHLTASSVLVVDLPQNGSTVERWLVVIERWVEEGKTFCFKAKEQTGTALNGYTPSGGICVTTGMTSANSGP